MSDDDGDKVDDDAPTAKAPNEHAATDRDRQNSEEPGQGESSEEIGGPKGPEPTRFGDWERKGRCIDF